MQQTIDRTEAVYRRWIEQMLSNTRPRLWDRYPRIAIMEATAMDKKPPTEMAAGPWYGLWHPEDNTIVQMAPCVCTECLPREHYPHLKVVHVGVVFVSFDDDNEFGLQPDFEALDDRVLEHVGWVYRHPHHQKDDPWHLCKEEPVAWPVRKKVFIHG